MWRHAPAAAALNGAYGRAGGPAAFGLRTDPDAVTRRRSVTVKLPSGRIQLREFDLGERCGRGLVRRTGPRCHMVKREATHVDFRFVKNCYCFLASSP